MDDRWDLDFHPEMEKCLLDYCEQLSDMVEGLRHMKFGFCTTICKSAHYRAQPDGLFPAPGSSSVGIGGPHIIRRDSCMGSLHTRPRGQGPPTQTVS